MLRPAIFFKMSDSEGRVRRKIYRKVAKRGASGKKSVGKLLNAARFVKRRLESY